MGVQLGLCFTGILAFMRIKSHKKSWNVENVHYIIKINIFYQLNYVTNQEGILWLNEIQKLIINSRIIDNHDWEDFKFSEINLSLIS